MARQRRNTILFIGFLLLAGIANLFSRLPSVELSTLLTCINYLIYIGLLLYWIEAVRFRLLPSAARNYILSAAVLMLLYMLLRIFKYRFAVSVIAMRYAVYAYWIPQLMIPALFLMTCIRCGTLKKERNESLLLIPAVALSLMVMTSDLHQLVYVPQIELARFSLATGTYSYNFGFYLLYAWMILTVLLGILILFLRAERLPKRAVLLLGCVLAAWIGLVLLEILVIEKHYNHRMFLIPEIYIFSLLGIFEICIQYRLIPYNENYAGFFQKLQIPTVITDNEYNSIFKSEQSLRADQNTLRSSLNMPIPLTPDLKLHGKKIHAGYAFWAEDESSVHRAQDKLQEANEMIEQENDLLREETLQKEKDAYLQSRHHIYHEIAEQLYPCQKRITQILNEAEPGQEDFRKKIALVSVLNAYVKRKSNLLLLAAEKDYLSLNELFLAIRESASYLTMAGLQTTAGEVEDRQLNAEGLLALYDGFESLAEQLIGKAPSLMVSSTKTGLRLAAETDCLPETKGISLPVNCRNVEGILYMELTAGREGDAA